MRNPGSGSPRSRHAAEMRRVVETFDRSELTIAAFCRAHGLSLSKLKYWRRRAAAAPRARGTSRTPFLEVEVVPEGDLAHGTIELRLPGGVIAVVRAGTPAPLIRELLRATGSAC